MRWLWWLHSLAAASALQLGQEPEQGDAPESAGHRCGPESEAWPRPAGRDDRPGRTGVDFNGEWVMVDLVGPIDFFQRTLGMWDSERALARSNNYGIGMIHETIAQDGDVWIMETKIIQDHLVVFYEKDHYIVGRLKVNGFGWKLCGHWSRDDMTQIVMTGTNVMPGRHIVVPNITRTLTDEGNGMTLEGRISDEAWARSIYIRKSELKWRERHLGPQGGNASYADVDGDEDLDDPLDW